MDALRKRLLEAGPAPEHPTTVLLAPSWGAAAIFSRYGGRIIEALLQTSYHVVVRPHPQSFASEADMMERLMAEYPESDQLEWNRDNDNFEVLRRSDIMVSDFSGVVYDFAFIFDRPVIYTEPNFDKGPYDAWWLDEDIWMFSTLPKIGRELTMDSLGGLKQMIDECLTDTRFREARDQARDEGWACQGHAAQTIVDYLEAKLAELAGSGAESEATSSGADAQEEQEQADSSDEPELSEPADAD
jgi:CDP-glycerol glycerophosphotransferase (TagB/SpsB family)